MVSNNISMLTVAIVLTVEVLTWLHCQLYIATTQKRYVHLTDGVFAILHKTERVHNAYLCSDN